MKPTCCRCSYAEHKADQLEEQVAFLKSELGIVEDAFELNRIRSALGVRGWNEAKIILRLMKAKKHVATHDLLHELVSTRHRELSSKNVDVYVCRLRKRLGDDAIKTIWGVGFEITPVGLAIMADLLSSQEQLAA